MNDGELFGDALDGRQQERRCHVFADIERIVGRLPHAYRCAAGRPARCRGVVLERLSRREPAFQGGGALVETGYARSNANPGSSGNASLRRLTS